MHHLTVGGKVTASITGRKRCVCGKYRRPLANGQLPRHTTTAAGRTCPGTGKFPPSVVTERASAKPGTHRHVQVPDQAKTKKPRGGRRAAKRNAGAKARYRRNSAGGYNR
jgi:hypothetical protein